MQLGENQRGTSPVGGPPILLRLQAIALPKMRYEAVQTATKNSFIGVTKNAFSLGASLEGFQNA
jgi:hypothetical protein